VWGVERLSLEELLMLDETGLDLRKRTSRNVIRYSIRKLSDGETVRVFRNSRYFMVQSLAAKEMYTRGLRKEMEHHFKNGDKRLRKIATPYIMFWNGKEI